MNTISDFLRHGATLPIVLAIIGILGLATVGSLIANPLSAIPRVDVRAESDSYILTAGDTFTVRIVVESSTPVNAFEGTVVFDDDFFTVQQIDYNTSIANLWVKEPWYSKGDGTIYFAGGTTNREGFRGTGTLMTITFSTTHTGTGFVGIKNARILQHDGLGTNAPLAPSIDTLFTVKQVQPDTKEVLRTSTTHPQSYVILDKPPSTDLNADGRQTIVDISIFMLHLTRQNLRSDFNGDGVVNTTDLSIILNAS